MQNGRNSPGWIGIQTLALLFDANPQDIGSPPPKNRPKTLFSSVFPYSFIFPLTYSFAKEFK